ncbi:MAG TPA: hypothetical protein VGH66_15210 [Acidimicrobiales bacterium]|jgi:hypothetical protein|nr:hypothetical protein [Trebonia sp.]
MTATDLDLDALLDALAARARARAETKPIYNQDGVDIGLRASTGRLVVHPGDVIASVWGNTTYDQTVQVYDTAAARDSQWPTPKDGAVCYTVDTGTLWLRRAGAWVAIGARYGARYTAGNVTSPATANTAQQIPLGTMVYDQASAVSGNVYHCPAAGRYLVRGSISGAAVPVSASVLCYLRRNGANDAIVQVFNPVAGQTVMIQSVTVIMCAAGDTLDLAWQTSATSIGLRANATESFFVVEYLGPS